MPGVLPVFAREAPPSSEIRRTKFREQKESPSQSDLLDDSGRFACSAAVVHSPPVADDEHPSAVAEQMFFAPEQLVLTVILDVGGGLFRFEWA